MSERTENDAVIECVKDLLEADILETDEGALFSVPKGRTLVDPRTVIQECYLDAPRRKRGTYQVRTTVGFCEFTNRHKVDLSVVFVDRERFTCQAIFDFHNPANGDAGHSDFVCKYEIKKSAEWKKWVSQNEEWMKQEQFAEFLDERIVDIQDSSAAGERSKNIASLLGKSIAGPKKLLDLSKGLSIRVGGELKNIINRDSGECEMVFKEEHTDEYGAPLKIPGLFIIAIPVFVGGVGYQIPVRLRYRKSGNGLVWQYQMHQSDVMVDDAFSQIVLKIKTETGLPVFE